VKNLVNEEEISEVAQLMKIHLDDHTDHITRVQKMLEYFDILDNIHFITKDIDAIINIYKSCCNAENVNTFYIKNHVDLYDLFILLSIIYPKYYLKNKINRKKSKKSKISKRFDRRT